MSAHGGATLPQVAHVKPNKGRRVHPKVALAEGLVEGVIALKDDSRLFVADLRARVALFKAQDHILDQFLAGQMNRDDLEHNRCRIRAATATLNEHTRARAILLNTKIIPEIMDCAHHADIDALHGVAV